MGTAVLWISILFRFSYMFDLIDDLYCSHFLPLLSTHARNRRWRKIKMRIPFPFEIDPIQRPARRASMSIPGFRPYHRSVSICSLSSPSSLFSSPSFLTHLKTVDLVVLHSVLFFVESCVLGCFCLVCEHPFLVVFSSAKMFRSTYPD